MGIYGDDSALLSQGYVLDPDYMGRGFGSYIKQADYDAKYGKPQPPPLPVVQPPPPAAPPPAAPAAPLPDPGPPLATEPTGPVVGTGGAIAGPIAAGNDLIATDNTGLGDALGEAVMKPPKYWVGGINQYGKKTGKTGAITTSNT